MRTCPLCKSTYADEVDVCPLDGSKLDARAARLDVTAAIAPPPGALLPFASIDEGEAEPVSRASAGSPHGGRSVLAVDVDGEPTQRDRRPLLQGSRKAGDGIHAAAASARAETSELERHDFSMLISSEPDEPELAAPESRIGMVYGSYRLLEVLGRGGMGCVYRAEHVKLGRDVALKLLREDYAQRRDAVTRFFQEARAVNLIRHRNIVDVIDYVELDDGIVFIIMELLAGQSLRRLMREPIELRRALAILAQICDGLAAAHSVGIVHRDLKPDNIIIVPSPDGGELVKLLDFGVAKLVDKLASGPGLTAVGAVIGTPAFMSPEQAGGRTADARSDVYSLGAIMYELFTREPLFRAKSFSEFVQRHLNDEPVRPSDLPGCEHIDPALEAIILRCLDKNPQARFDSALELRTSLLALPASPEAQTPGEGAARSHRSSASMPAQPAPAPTRRMRPASAPPLSPLLPVWRASDTTGEVVTKPHPRARSPQLEASVPLPEAALAAGMAGTRGIAEGVPSGARETFDRLVPAVTDSEGPDTDVTPRPGPLAFGTLNPYSAPAPVALEPAVPAPSERPGALRLLARCWHKRLPEVWLIGGAILVLVVAAIAFVIPLMARESDERLLATTGPVVQVAAGSRERLTSSSTAQTSPLPIVTPVASEDADFDRPLPASPPAGNDLASRRTPLGASSSGGRNATENDQNTWQARDSSAGPIRVRVVSRPAGLLHASGDRGSLCQTPCTLSINPEDGVRQRLYVIRKPGYKDDTITIDLLDPPTQIEVELEKLGSRAGRSDPVEIGGTERNGKKGARVQGERETTDESEGAAAGGDQSTGARDALDPNDNEDPFGNRTNR